MSASDSPATQALARAEARMSEDRLTVFEKLAPELKAGILDLCDLTSVINVASTGPVFYHYVKGSEARMAANLVNSLVVEKCRPLAVVRCLANEMGKGRVTPRNEAEEAIDFAKVHSFIDNVLKPGLNKFDPIRVPLTLSMTRQISSFEDDIACFVSSEERVARILGTAWSDIDVFIALERKLAELEGYIESGTDWEVLRTARALYILQLSHDLFHLEFDCPQQYKDSDRLRDVHQKFRLRFKAWERLQVKRLQGVVRVRVASGIVQDYSLAKQRAS
ncbi:hypothetical protein Hte_001322 [Hypoxylon texense]